jgi:hypothetical protein
VYVLCSYEEERQLERLARARADENSWLVYVESESLNSALSEP